MKVDQTVWTAGKTCRGPWRVTERKVVGFTAAPDGSLRILVSSPGLSKGYPRRPELVHEDRATAVNIARAKNEELRAELDNANKWLV